MNSGDDKKQIETARAVYPQIYAYTLPQLSDHDGWQKVGYTERENVWDRINEQTHTAAINLNANLRWRADAVKDNGKWFTDKALHRFYVKNGVKRSGSNGFGQEWFYFDGTPEKSRQLLDDFRRGDTKADARSVIPYTLRHEQRRAVNDTVEYYAEHHTTDFNHPDDKANYLWNAKPRFGKTLTSYDFAKRIGAKYVLIITNRPAIANSWYDDYKKFVSDYYPYFVSTADSLKERPTISWQEFTGRTNPTADDKVVVFLSMQDLKGGKVFGGNFDKLEWVAQTPWDLMIVDEAHEGTRTDKTHKAFEHINRGFTLWLSGTPFKALAGGDFKEEQIFNWSYIDEQRAKEVELKDGNESGEHTDLPDMRLFTYKMSDIVADNLSAGVDIDGVDYSYAFDLNEMFSTNDSGNFVHENEIRIFLDQLTTNEKYPFSTPQLRDELYHTFWLVGNRVASAKAMARLLKKHPVFGEYEIIVAAGDGKLSTGVDDDDDFTEESSDYDQNMDAYARVRNAIKHSGKKTITLSVGQLTTGVTIPEWSAVLMLSDISSPALYMQAMFRAQNPNKWRGEDGKMYRKKSAYVFDFSPNRVLRVYDDFANNLKEVAVEGRITDSERRVNIGELLNYFPVLAEDNQGKMVELDAEKVLTYPKALVAKEIVKRGFVTNLLFKNITNVFNIPAEVINSLNKAKSSRSDGRMESRAEKVDHDPERKAKMEKRISVNNAKLLGNKVYGDAMLDVVKRAADITADDPNRTAAQTVNDITDAYLEQIEEPIARYIEEYRPTKEKVEAVRKEQAVKVRKLAEEYVSKDIQDRLNQQALASKMADLVESDLPASTVQATEQDNYDKEEKDEWSEIRAKLRTFTRAIPSFIMASQMPISEITLKNIEDTVSDADFEELFTEKNAQEPFTKDDFRKIRGPYTTEDGQTFDGFFDEYAFNAAIREFEEKREKLANYLDDSETDEDIFTYIRPLKTNQIFTPRKVVNEMLNALEEEYPNIFRNPEITFCDTYVKSGLFLTEIAKRLNKGLMLKMPDAHERIEHIFNHQLYGYAPTEIIYHISHKYIYGIFEDKSEWRDGEIDDSHLKLHDLTNDFKQGKKLDMKFDVIVGNPPYQEDDGGHGASATPVYNKFVDAAEESGASVISFVMPSRWFAGGKGLDEFRDKMLKDRHIRLLSDYADSKALFQGVDIKGGVCYFIRDNRFTGPAKIIEHTSEGDVEKSERYLNAGNASVFIRSEKLLDILNKVWGDSHSDVKNMSSIISVRKPYGFCTDIIGNEAKYNLPRMSSEPIEGGYELLGLAKNKRTKRYLPNDYPIPRTDWLNYYKVFITKASGSGDYGEEISEIVIGTPKTTCSESFLQVGKFSTRIEAENCSKYIRTKFVRALLGIRKTTQDVNQSKYALIPLQDFTSNSDIDWSKSISEIDQQLYRKYGLTNDEINFIETKIKPME